MKKQRIFLTAVMMLFAGFAFAQFTDQGNFIIGSTIGFSTADSKISLESSTGMSVTENPASTQFNISPRVENDVRHDLRWLVERSTPNP